MTVSPESKVLLRQLELITPATDLHTEVQLLLDAHTPDTTQRFGFQYAGRVDLKSFKLDGRFFSKAESELVTGTTAGLPQYAVKASIGMGQTASFPPERILDINQLLNEVGLESKISSHDFKPGITIPGLGETRICIDFDSYDPHSVIKLLEAQTLASITDNQCRDMRDKALETLKNIGRNIQIRFDGKNGQRIPFANKDDFAAQIKYWKNAYLWFLRSLYANGDLAMPEEIALPNGTLSDWLN